MRKPLGVVCLLFAPSSEPETAAPRGKRPLQPLPEDCPTCTEYVARTCRRCATCKPIPACKT